MERHEISGSLAEILGPAASAACFSCSISPCASVSSCNLSSVSSTAGDATGDVCDDFRRMRAPLRLDDDDLFATKLGLLRNGFCVALVELLVAAGLLLFPFSVLVASFEFFRLGPWLGFSGTTILVVL